jgi:hypothetical protein
MESKAEKKSVRRHHVRDGLRCIMVGHPAPVDQWGACEAAR